MIPCFVRHSNFRCRQNSSTGGITADYRHDVGADVIVIVKPNQIYSLVGGPKATCALCHFLYCSGYWQSNATCHRALNTALRFVIILTSSTYLRILWGLFIKVLPYWILIMDSKDQVHAFIWFAALGDCACSCGVTKCNMHCTKMVRIEFILSIVACCCCSWEPFNFCVLWTTTLTLIKMWPRVGLSVLFPTD